MKFRKYLFGIVLAAQSASDVARADALITVQQIGFDVVAEVSGSLDLSNEPSPTTTIVAEEGFGGTISPSSDCIAVGKSLDDEVTSWGSFTSKPSQVFTIIGPAARNADVSEGDYISICGGRAAGGALRVETGFSGEISGTAIWQNETYQRLNVPAPGRYIWETEGGETITLEVQQQGPLPTVSSVLTIRIKEQGRNVLAMVSGELDLRLLPNESEVLRVGVGSAASSPRFKYLALGQLDNMFSIRSRFSVFNQEPSSSIFTSDSRSIAATGSTGLFFAIGEGVADAGDYLLHPAGFISDSLEGTTTWKDAGIEQLGLIPGSYVWEMANGATLRMVIEEASTDQIPPVSVPGIGPVILLVLVLAVLGITALKRLFWFKGPSNF